MPEITLAYLQRIYKAVEELITSIFKERSLSLESLDFYDSRAQNGLSIAGTTRVGLFKCFE